LGVKDDIDELRKSFNEIDKSILDGAKEFRTLSESISKTNAVLGSKNWQIFSRFISGTPLWRIQNRIKATVMLLNELQLAGEKRRTEQAKELKNFSKLAKLQRDNVGIQDKLNSLKELAGKTDEKSVKEYQSQMAALRETSELFDGMVFKLGDQNDAIKEMSNLIKNQVDAGNKLQEQAKETANLRKKEGEGEFQHLGRIMKFKMKSNSMTKAFAKFKEKTDKKGHAFNMKTYQKEIKLTEKMKNIAAKAGLDPQELLRKDGSMKDPTADRNTKQVVMRRGSSGKVLNPKQFKALQDLHKLGKKQNSRSKKFYRIMSTPVKMMGAFFKKVLAYLLKMVLYAAASFMKMLLLLMVTIAAFKMIQPFLGNIKDALEIGVKVLLDGLALIWSGLSKIWEGVGGMIDGIMNLDIMQFLEGLWTVLVGMAEVLAGLLQVVFGAVIAAGIGFISSLFKSGFDKVGGGIKGIASGIVNVAKGVAGVIGAIALVIGTIGLLIGAAFALPALIVAGIAILIYLVITKFEDQIVWFITKIGEFVSTIKQLILDLPKGIGDAIRNIGGGIKKGIGKAWGGLKGMVGLSTGGRIKQGGMALVGEKGPELVTLPRGAQVHSNSKSKAMASSVTNHITVQVTGRVGASDTEIRDIANKVAKEINSRMNRTSTSVVKF